MKTLYFLRHAKSDWGDMALSDHQRPLNARGRRATAKIGAALRQQGVNPGKVLCSTAVRARETLERVMQAGDFDWPVHYVAELYGASADRILAVIREQPDAQDSLLLVGHNPGFQDIVLGLVDSEEKEGLLERVSRKLPTGAFTHIEFHTDTFRDISLGAGHLADFFKPKDKTIV